MYATKIKAIKDTVGYDSVKYCSSKYMNNIIEQDHRRIKRKIISFFEFRSFESASITIASIESFQMIKKNKLV